MDKKSPDDTVLVLRSTMKLAMKFSAIFFWSTIDYPYSSLEFHRVPYGSLEFYRVPYGSLEFLRIS